MNWQERIHEELNKDRIGKEFQKQERIKDQEKRNLEAKTFLPNALNYLQEIDTFDLLSAIQKEIWGSTGVITTTEIITNTNDVEQLGKKCASAPYCDARFAVQYSLKYTYESTPILIEQYLGKVTYSSFNTSGTDLSVATERLYEYKLGPEKRVLETSLGIGTIFFIPRENVNTNGLDCKDRGYYIYSKIPANRDSIPINLSSEKSREVKYHTVHKWVDPNRPSDIRNPSIKEKVENYLFEDCLSRSKNHLLPVDFQKKEEERLKTLTRRVNESNSRTQVTMKYHKVENAPPTL